VTRASIVEALRAISARAAALMRNAWLAWVRHREVRRKEALRLEVARRQRERRAAVAAATVPDDEPAVEPHAAAPIPVAATDLLVSAPPTARPPQRPPPAAAPPAPRRGEREGRGAGRGTAPVRLRRDPDALHAPPLSLLNPPTHDVQVDEKELVETARILTEKCREFDVTGQVIAIQPGPVVTVIRVQAGSRREVQQDRHAVGGPVPGDRGGVDPHRPHRRQVDRRHGGAEQEARDDLPARASGGRALPEIHGAPHARPRKEINGEPYYADLARMPHLLVAGSTGSGKSVSVNTFLTSILYKSSPEEVKFIMIDPKRLELGLYENIPHLLTPLVTDTKKAANALRWAVLEMERRYKQLAEAGVRGIDQYNLVVRRDLKERAAAAGVATAPADGTAAAAAATVEESAPPRAPACRRSPARLRSRCRTWSSSSTSWPT